MGIVDRTAPARLSRRGALVRLGRGGAVVGAVGMGAVPAAGSAAARLADGAPDKTADCGCEPETAAPVAAATRAKLPEVAVETAGRLRYLTDDDRSLWLDNGLNWFSLGGEVFDVRAFGAAGDGVTDDWGAFHAAIDAMTSARDEESTSPYGRTLSVPPGTYRLAQSLVLDRAVRIVGAGTGGPFGDTVLLVDAGIVGVVIAAADPLLTGRPGRRGVGSILERLRIEAAAGGGGAPAAHGVWLQAPATVRDCQIAGFSGDGIRVGIADTDVAANGWSVAETRVQRCGGNALGVAGEGAGGGTCQALTAVGNSGWAVADEETRGSTYLHCRADGNGQGAYLTTGANNRGIFIGCDAETGQPRSRFAAATVVVGGDHRAGYEGGNAWTATGSRMTLLAQDPGRGESPLPTEPTLTLQGGRQQAQPHLRVLDAGGDGQAQLDATGRLFLGPFGPAIDTGGAAAAQAILLQLGHPDSGVAGIRWVALGDSAGWVAQARAYREEAGPDAQPGFGDVHLTFQTPDAGGAELDTLTLRQGNVGIGTTQPVARLDVESTTSGFLPPRLTTEQRDAIPAPPEGLLVYNLTTHRLDLFVGDAWRELDLTPIGG
jgi:hypothetical protein